MAWFEIARGLHMLFAILWVGGGIFVNVIPDAALKHNLEARQTFWAKTMHGPYLGVTSLLTLLFGLLTYFALPFEPSEQSTGYFMALNIGMLGGIVGVLVGFLGHLPNMNKLVKAIENGDDTTALFEKEDRLAKISFVVTAIALVAMTSLHMW